MEDNIRLGKLDATSEEIVEAAKMANAHGFILGLPEVRIRKFLVWIIYWVDVHQVFSFNTYFYLRVTTRY